MTDASKQFMRVVQTDAFREGVSSTRVLSAIVQMYQYMDLSHQIVLENFHINMTGFTFTVSSRDLVRGEIHWNSLHHDGQPATEVSIWLRDPVGSLSTLAATDLGEALSRVSSVLHYMRSVVPIALDPLTMDAKDRGEAMARACVTWRRIEGVQS